MNVFTEVYDKSRTILQTQSLDASWSKIETNLKVLLQADGPDSGKASVLGDIRKQLRAAGKRKLRTRVAMAEEVLKASKTGTPGFQDRAAMIKMLIHLYLVEKKGNQDIWAVDPPKAYGKWTFDEFANKTEENLKKELIKRREVFGKSNRKMMSDAHQLARKWASQVEIALANKDKKTKKIQK